MVDWDQAAALIADMRARAAIVAAEFSEDTARDMLEACDIAEAVMMRDRETT